VDNLIELQLKSEKYLGNFFLLVTFTAYCSITGRVKKENIWEI